MKYFFLTFASCFLFLSSQAKVLEKILAVVNGQAITLSELQQFKKDIKTGNIDHVLLSLTPAETLKTTKEQLEFLIQKKVMDSQIESSKLTVSKAKVDEQINNILKRQGATKPQLMQSLKASGRSFSDYRRIIKNSMETQRLIQKEILSRIKISNEDIMDYYVKSSGQKNMVFQYKLAHILLLKETPQAQDKLSAIKKQISEGKDFGQLAKKHSQDPNLQPQGLLGEFRSTEIRKEMREAVDDLKAGEVSDIVTSPYGYSLIKVLNKKLVANQVDKKTTENIKQKLMAGAFKTRLSQWIREKRDDAFVKIN